MRLTALEGEFSVYRFDADSAAPEIPPSEEAIYSVTRTREEVSVVCRTGILHGAPREEAGWTLWRVEGPLDFGLIGVLSSITAPLAAAGVSVFALSTFDTDYILWKTDQAAAAVRALRSAGFEVEGSARFP